MKQLELHNLKVSYGGRTVLQVERAFFQQGRFYGVVGPSGSGKSTLLRILNLLERPLSGRLNFFGTEIDLAHLTYKKGIPIQRQMGYVAQKPAMFQTSVYDNVALGLRYRGVDKKTIRRLVMEALEQVELAHLADQRADTLSGGEAQRIALARALVCEPTLLLLDEPTASLDPYNITIFERVVQTFHREKQTTILMVTHNLPQARRLAQTCLFVFQGEIVETAETDTFFNRPASPMLQDFVMGRMIC